MNPNSDKYWVFLEVKLILFRTFELVLVWVSKQKFKIIARFYTSLDCSILDRNTRAGRKWYRRQTSSAFFVL